MVVTSGRLLPQLLLLLLQVFVLVGVTAGADASQRKKSATPIRGTLLGRSRTASGDDVSRNGRRRISMAVTGQSSSVNASSCVACPRGTYGNCTLDPYDEDPCPRGSCPHTANCTACPAGSAAGPNSTECLRCLVGWFNPAGDPLGCRECPPGESTFGPTKGADCLPCPVGYAAPRNGSACGACPQGTSTNGMVHSTACADCLPGSYSPAPGEGSCTPCGSGWYGTSARGLTSAVCLTCPEGFYCPDSVTQYPTECPAGSFCPQGSSTPTKCQAMFQSGTGAGACTATGGFFALLFSAIGVCCVGSVGGYFLWRRRRRGPERPSSSFISTADTRLDSQRLIPRPKDAPMYDGM